MSKTKRRRVPIVNMRSIGTMCGHGEGRTEQDAIDDALRQARQRDPEAFFSDVAHCVYFAEDVRL